MGRAGRTMPCDTPMEKAIPFLVVSAFREEESCSYYIVNVSPKKNVVLISIGAKQFQV
jgi:hypothetical protein